MNAYDIVRASREKGRPTAQKYIDEMVEGFIELHGDRRFADDAAIIGGIGRMGGRPVTVIGIEKGADTKSKVARNFGCAHPEGYRKAVRLMQQAEKFHRPVLCLVDTSGAYCGIGAEERGQSEAIATAIFDMIRLKTPALTLIIGEGGSGGALGLSPPPEGLVTETSSSSALSPPGGAPLFWKDATKVARAAECLKMTAPDLIRLGAVERVIPEQGFSPDFYVGLKAQIVSFFEEKSRIPAADLVEARYARFRKF